MMATVDTEKLYKVPEFAKLANISKIHAYRLVDRGAVPSVRLGRRILIPGWFVAQLLGNPGQELPPSA